MIWERKVSTAGRMLGPTIRGRIEAKRDGGPGTGDGILEKWRIRA